MKDNFWITTGRWLPPFLFKEDVVDVVDVEDVKDDASSGEVEVETRPDHC